MDRVGHQLLKGHRAITRKSKDCPTCGSLLKAPSTHTFSFYKYFYSMSAESFGLQGEWYGNH